MMLGDLVHSLTQNRAIFLVPVSVSMTQLFKAKLTKSLRLQYTKRRQG